MGGYPAAGRRSYGPEASGKTTSRSAVGWSRRPRSQRYHDAERARRGLGPDLWRERRRSPHLPPDTGEQALEITETLVRSGAIDVIVVDSVAALTPRAEIEGEMGDAHMGLQARLMSQALRKLTGTVSKTGTTIIFINQLREKIGVMFGNPETTTGGKALKFYASIRLDVRPIEPIKNGTEIIGRRVKVKVVKNKVSPPFRIAEMEILASEGISKEGGLIDMGIVTGVVSKYGAWINYGEQRLGQGRENAKQYLRDHKDVAAELEKKVREKSGAAALPVGGPDGDE